MTPPGFFFGHWFCFGVLWRIFAGRLAAARAAVAAIVPLIVATASTALAQAPPLGTVDTFAVLGGSTVTNTGPTVLSGTAALPGNLGVSPGTAITGFFAVDGGPGILTGPGASIHQNDAVAIQAQIDLTTAYNNLLGRAPTVNLTGQNLGGLTLVPGTYNFSSAAQLTGGLTLNGLGNPNSVFVFNIASTLTTANASTVTLINAAQGGNVFWRVGSSATLGSTTAFAGDILAQASVTLNTGATITCGAAWAQSGAVTLDTNTISVCDVLVGPGGIILGPTGVPLFTALLPPGATANEFAVAAGLDNAVNGGALLPVAFLNLFNLSPADLATALGQLSGELGTAVAPAGVLATNSFLSLVTGPFVDSRDVAPPPPPPPLIYKTSFYKAPSEAAPEPSRWGVWTAAYGGTSTADGDPLVGSNDRSARVFGSALGLDYRITPYTLVGIALGAGGTNFGLAQGLGSGHSDMFQAAVYSFSRVNAAYMATALAYTWERESTVRFLDLGTPSQLDAAFPAYGVGGRIEGGYRFAMPGAFAVREWGLIPYAALQMQTFRTPAYGETAASGSPSFALAYNGQATTTTRTELGAWADDAVALHDGAMLAFRARAAWAHDYWSDSSMTAAFQALPGSNFTVTGALPLRDSLLASVGVEIGFRNGISLAALADSELNENSQTYIGTIRARYAW